MEQPAKAEGRESGRKYFETAIISFAKEIINPKAIAIRKAMSLPADQKTLMI